MLNHNTRGARHGCSRPRKRRVVFRPHDPAIRQVIGETHRQRFEDLNELGDRVRRGSELVAPQGFEPRYAAPEAAVLPLNEGAMRSTKKPADSPGFSILRAGLPLVNPIGHAGAFWPWIRKGAASFWGDDPVQTARPMIQRKTGSGAHPGGHIQAGRGRRPAFHLDRRGPTGELTRKLRGFGKGCSHHASPGRSSWIGWPRKHARPVSERHHPTFPHSRKLEGPHRSLPNGQSAGTRLRYLNPAKPWQTHHDRHCHR
jgi:hypothetical protein